MSTWCFTSLWSFFLGALLFHSLPLLSLGSFQVFSWGSSASVESPVHSATGSSLWAESAAYLGSVRSSIVRLSFASLRSSLSSPDFCFSSFLLISSHGPLFQWVSLSLRALASPSLPLVLPLGLGLRSFFALLCCVPLRCFALVLLRFAFYGLRLLPAVPHVFSFALEANALLPVCPHAPSIGLSISLSLSLLSRFHGLGSFAGCFLLRSCPRLLSFFLRYLACLLLSLLCRFLGYGLVLFLVHLLPDSVKFQFLRDGVSL